MKADNHILPLNRAMYKKIFRAIQERPQDAACLQSYLSATRHLERTADYATNIAEDVIYMIEGRIVRHGGSAEQPES